MSLFPGETKTKASSVSRVLQSSSAMFPETTVSLADTLVPCKWRHSSRRCSSQIAYSPRFTLRQNTRQNVHCRMLFCWTWNVEDQPSEGTDCKNNILAKAEAFSRPRRKISGPSQKLLVYLQLAINSHWTCKKSKSCEGPLWRGLFSDNFHGNPCFGRQQVRQTLGNNPLWFWWGFFSQFCHSNNPSAEGATAQTPRHLQRALRSHRNFLKFVFCLRPRFCIMGVKGSPKEGLQCQKQCRT